MKNQLLFVIAILSSTIASFAQSGPSANGLPADMLYADMRQPPKKDLEATIRKYRDLMSEAQRKGVNLDAGLVGAWTTNVQSLEKAMSLSAESYGKTDISAQYRTVNLLNGSVQTNITDTERIIVIECCHKIKEGTPCTSLEEKRKDDLKKCEKAHKK